MTACASAQDNLVAKQRSHSLLLFFFNDTATTEIYTLSLHDALPIYYYSVQPGLAVYCLLHSHLGLRSEEHTSELQSLRHLVCRLLLEKKIKNALQFTGDSVVVFLGNHHVGIYAT